MATRKPAPESEPKPEDEAPPSPADHVAAISAVNVELEEEIFVAVLASLATRGMDVDEAIAKAKEFAEKGAALYA